MELVESAEVIAALLPPVPAEQDVSRLIPFLVLQANTADWMSSPSPDDPEKLAAILKLME